MDSTAYFEKATAQATSQADVSDIGNLGTPTFTPSSWCTEDIYTVLGSDEDDGWARRSHLHLGISTSTSDCMPTDWEDQVTHVINRWVSFQSPGVCPEGYTFACANSRTDTAETTATCCPSGYDCRDEISYSWQNREMCISSMPATASYNYNTYIPKKDSPAGNSAEIKLESPDTVYAFGLEIHFQSTDIILPTKTSEGVVTISSDSSEEPATNNLGKSVGIGVGAVLSGAGIIIIAWLLWRRRKKSHLKRNPENNLVEMDPPRKEMKTRLPSELETGLSVQRYEMYVEPSELDAGVAPTELEARSPTHARDY